MFTLAKRCRGPSSSPGQSIPRSPKRPRSFAMLDSPTSATGPRPTTAAITLASRALLGISGNRVNKDLTPIKPAKTGPEQTVVEVPIKLPQATREGFRGVTVPATSQNKAPVHAPHLTTPTFQSTPPQSSIKPSQKRHRASSNQSTPKGRRQNKKTKLLPPSPVTAEARIDAFSQAFCSVNGDHPSTQAEQTASLFARPRVAGKSVGTIQTSKDTFQAPEHGPLIKVAKRTNKRKKSLVRASSAKHSLSEPAVDAPLFGSPAFTIELMHIKTTAPPFQQASPTLVQTTTGNEAGKPLPLNPLARSFRPVASGFLLPSIAFIAPCPSQPFSKQVAVSELLASSTEPEDVAAYPFAGLLPSLHAWADDGSMGDMLGAAGFWPDSSPSTPTPDFGSQSTESGNAPYVVSSPESLLHALGPDGWASGCNGGVACLNQAFSAFTIEDFYSPCTHGLSPSCDLDGQLGGTPFELVAMLPAHNGGQVSSAEAPRGLLGGQDVPALIAA